MELAAHKGFTGATGVAVFFHRGPATTRVDGWLALALLAAANGDVRRTLACCRRGLDLLGQHRNAECHRTPGGQQTPSSARAS